MLRGCIFDFDGVVLDTEKYHYLAWKAVADELKVVFAVEEYLPLKSAGKLSILQYLLKKRNTDITDQLYIEKWVDKIISDFRNQTFQLVSTLII